MQGCARYFGAAVAEVVAATIEIAWDGPRRFSVTVTGSGRRLDWSLTLTSPFPDLEIVIEKQLEAGDTVVTEMRFTGTQTAPMTTPQGVLPPTGRRVDVPGCVLHTVRDGRITQHTGYYDQLLFLGQLGLLPEPARS